MTLTTTPRRGELVVAVLLLCGTFVLAAVRDRPPEPLPATAPPDLFSAARAEEQLKALVGNGVPHPTGSKEDDRIREQLVQTLRQLGYEPRVQSSFVCSAHGSCASVKNVLARLPGREPGKAVLLATHYDSVPAGPGASDDGSGVVALLEVARALKAAPPLRRPVIFLIDEGEELGLLGAKAFADSDPWRDQVGVVVNADTGGTRGLSRMFETSGPNGWLVRTLSDALRFPVASSLFPAVYELMPRDTDLTVFKQRGIPGVNFAFIGGSQNYHTPLDDIAHLDPGTLQHLGDNVLAMVRAFAGQDLGAVPPPDRAVFFDVLSIGLLSWPERWTRALAVLAFAMVVLCAVVLTRRRAVRFAQISTATTGLLLALAFSVGVAALLTKVLISRPDFVSSTVASAGPAIAAFWAVGLMTCAWVIGWLFRRSPPVAMWLATWLLWSSLGLAVAWKLPGGSYLCIVPALVAGVCGLLSLLLGRVPSQAVPIVLPAMAVGVLWFPLTLAWYDVLGLPVLFALSLAAALITSTLSPLIVALDERTQWRAVMVTTAAALALSAVTWRLPQTSADVPAPVSFVLFEDADTGRTRWLAETPTTNMPAALQARMPFGDVEQPLSWSQRRFRVRDASPAGLAPPAAAVLADETQGRLRHLQLRVTSARQAPGLIVAFAPETQVEALSIDGVPAEVHDAPAGIWPSYSIATPAEGGHELSVTVPAGKPLRLTLADVSLGLPAQGAPLAEARRPLAVPRHLGDRVVVSKTVRY